MEGTGWLLDRREEHQDQVSLYIFALSTLSKKERAVQTQTYRAHLPFPSLPSPSSPVSSSATTSQAIQISSDDFKTLNEKFGREWTTLV